jgi:hypothetical protein
LETILLPIANVACATVFGGMLAFTAFFAPQAFRLLPEGVSDKFVRDLFPQYYLFAFILAAIATVAFAPIRLPETIVMGLVAAGFLFSRHYLMPRTVRAHDEREKGTPGAAEDFADLHKRSAFINMVQFIGTCVVLVRSVA